MSDPSNAVLPSGWARRPLGDVVDILDRLRVPVNAEEREKRSGSIPYYGATGQVGWIDKHLFDEELVLLGEDGAPFLHPSKPKAYVVRGKSWVNNHAHVLRGRGVSNLFLMHQLNALDYHGAVTGTTRLKLPQAPMKKLSLVVPPPDQQARIVAEIEKQFTRLDVGVEALKRLQAHLRRYRAAVLIAACSGSLVPPPRRAASDESAHDFLGRMATLRAARQKRQALAPESGLPSLPRGWEWATLDQLTGVIRNGISAKPDRDQGLKILRISAVRPLRVDVSDVRYLPDMRGGESDYLLSEGDLLFTRYNGNYDLVGVCGRVPALAGPLVHPDKLIRACLLDQDLGRYVEIAANAGVSRAFVASRVRTTAGQAGISGADLRATPIPIPPPSERRLIVAEVQRRLSLCDAVGRTVESSLHRATTLRSSLLHAAFEGRLGLGDIPLRATLGG
ncbi:MAG: restriction endonuclease subunit S [Deltaproteobacteria bacterium]|nr:restriction endonuclease subunit S [Deltaproteobacteria bacterium]